MSDYLITDLETLGTGEAMICRRYIYHSTYHEVIEWAVKEWDMHKTKSPNGKKIFESFPFALKEYIKACKKGDVIDKNKQ